MTHGYPIPLRAAPAIFAVLLVLAVASFGEEKPTVPPPDIVQELRGEAAALSPWVKSDLAREFLSATTRLRVPSARKLYRDMEHTHYYDDHLAEAIPAAEREKLEEVEAGPDRYYLTKYGSPLAYVRVIDLLAGKGLRSLAGKKVLDFGYGTIGHLELMADLGAETVGVDVDPFLTALYSQPGDQGVRKNDGKPDGKITLVQGQWPSTDEVRNSVGSGFDVFISKNTLKRGYIHPARETDPKRLVHLGVDDATYVKRLFEALKPGGYAIIYNLSPAQNPPDKPYIPWADGECPFPRDLLEKAGFEILDYDLVDDKPAREMAHLLGWDAQGMDLDKSLFAHVTILKKPGAS